MTLSFCWCWFACTDIRVIVYFEWSPPIPLENGARVIWKIAYYK